MAGHMAAARMMMTLFRKLAELPYLTSYSPGLMTAPGF
jgi:hypothetical protein